MEPSPAPPLTQDPLAQVKEVKLQLPLRTHVNLHSLKLLRSQSIRDSVVQALDSYFQSHPVAGIGLGLVASD